MVAGAIALALEAKYVAFLRHLIGTGVYSYPVERPPCIDCRYFTPAESSQTSVIGICQRGSHSMLPLSQHRAKLAPIQSAYNCSLLSHVCLPFIL